MEELEKDYKKISESINEIIPCDWDKVWVYAEILDDSAGITFTLLNLIVKSIFMDTIFPNDIE